MALAPVDYGPAVRPDTEGLDAAQRATSAVFQDAHQLGQVVEGGAQVIGQGILHTQALKATAAVKERQASTLQFIDSNPTVPKAVLQQRMAPDDYAAWHAGLATEYQDKEAVPMFSAAGALFDSEAKQAREAAGQVISLPGWRGAWDATQRTESATIRERYVNRLAADQMIADQRGQGILAIDKVIDAAVRPEDLDTAAKMAATNPWFKPAERRILTEKALQARDSFTARQGMLAGDTDVMKSELDKLRGPDAVTEYPNMNAKQRLDLGHQLAREYGFKAAKDSADKEIVGPNVSETGKVDHAGIEKALTAYEGANKADVVKAVRAEVGERDNLFNAQMSDLQKSIFTAGQDPKTAEFSMRRAMRDPDAREAAARLNQDAPGLLSALGKEDQRYVNIAARETAAQRREERAQLISTSTDTLDNIHRIIDDPTRSADLRALTPQQFDSMLLDKTMTEPDRQRARTAFAAFQKAGRPDERPQAAVAAELKAAAKEDPFKLKELKSKYGDVLLESAHSFIRANATLPPDEMTDKLREHLRGELLNGVVVGSSSRFYPDDTARRLDWERKPEFAGKDFKLPDGTVISAAKGQKVHLTSPDGKQSGRFTAEDAAAARADGWK